jgi:acetolactate synthase-1/2/3 large subunit
MARELDGGRAVVHALERNGVRHVFGIPGDHTLPIYRGLGESSIRHITVRHEQGAGFAADGYGRVSGRPGVAVVVTGPGVSNIATAMGEATTDSAPVLVLSAEVPRADIGAGRDHNHELRDQRALAAGVTRWSERAMDVAAIGPLIDRAFADLATGAPGAIHIGVPIDVLAETGPAEDAAPVRAERPAPDSAAIEAAARALDGAERPLVIVGGGARQAGRAIGALVQRLGAPVLATWNGKGVLGDDHPLSAGGGFHHDAALALLAEADVVLAIGTRLGRSDFWFAPPSVPGRLIRVDIDAAGLTANAAPGIPIHADASLAADALASAIRARPPDTERAAAARAAIDAATAVLGARHRPWLAAFREALPPETAIVADSTTVTYVGYRWLPVPAAGRWLYPSSFGTLGYALPAAIGARVAEPGRPAAVLIGDGGFLFTCPELLTAAEQGLPLPVLVWNDRGFGSIRLGMQEAGMEPVGVEFAVPDLASIAAGFGARYAAPGTPAELGRVTREALRHPGPTLIEMDDHLAGPPVGTRPAGTQPEDR